MMNRPRWLLAFGTIIAINTLAVIVSSVWHLARAQERPLAQSPASLSSDLDTSEAQNLEDRTTSQDELDLPLESRADSSLPSQPGESGKADSRGSQTANRSVDVDDGVSNLLPPSLESQQPTSIPAEIPSLASEEDLSRDPIFQEFKNMFGGASRETPSLAPPTTTYFESLRKRLQTAEQLTVAAHKIAEEAERLHLENRPEASEKLLKMTVQLREIAAELLISEL